ncbi:MAG: hypothetical protein AAF787_10315 [Chloroflexota bacterium]
MKTETEPEFDGDGLKARVKALLHEIEYTHLKMTWATQMIEAGVAESDVHQWVAEIGHVVDEYERSLRFLVDMLEKQDKTEAVQDMHSWLAYTRDMTMWTLDDVTSAMQGKYEHYLPDEYEDTDEL